jgi:glutathione-regulated potassium-efflux system protein KefB
MAPEAIVVSAVLLLSVTAVAVALFKRLGLGSALGLLVAGIIVGPHTSGPHVIAHVEEIWGFAELGVVLLLFMIGLEIRPQRLWSLRREVFGLGTLQIVLTGVAIAAYAATFEQSRLGALLIGLTLALSSTAFVVQLLQERGEVASRHGNTAVAVLLMQDLAVVPLLALVPLLADHGAAAPGPEYWQRGLAAAGAFVLVAAVGRFAVPYVLERLGRDGNREAFLLVVMLAVFLAALVMHRVGLSMALGAFMMGMLLSGSRYNLQIQALVEPYKGLLMSLFFVAIGMSIDPGQILDRPALFVQLVVTVTLIKIGVLAALGLAFGLPRSLVARISFLLAQGGEFGFVVFGAARALGVIDDATFSTMAALISLSMLATPALVRAGDRLAQRMERRRPEPARYRDLEEAAETPARVIIGGYGRVGHTVAVILHGSGIPFLAFDTDPDRVARGKADGFAVHYGDIGDPRLLDAARVDRAALVVLTVDHGPTALRALSHLRASYPQTPVIARARDLEACGRLLQGGATSAFPEAVESSLLLAANALELVGVPVDNVDQLLQGVRAQNYRLVRQNEPGGAPRT